MANGSWQLANGKWQLATGNWQLATGKWQMANGNWQLANGKWQMVPSLFSCFRHSSCASSVICRICETYDLKEDRLGCPEKIENIFKKTSFILHIQFSRG